MRNLILWLAILFVTFTTESHASCVRASWYHQGRMTASGERFNPDGHTAAHKTLPFGTVINVTNPRTGLSVNVRINDRGPFVKGRDLDLSRGAARAIGFTGVGSVCYG